MMTIMELAEYLRLHVITVQKYAARGKIPAMRIVRVSRFDKNTIDDGIVGDRNRNRRDKNTQKGSGFMKPRR